MRHQELLQLSDLRRRVFLFFVPFVSLCWKFSVFAFLRPNIFNTKTQRAQRRVLLAIALSLAAAAHGQELPGGAKPLKMEGDIALAMVEGLHSFLDAETAASVGRRAAFWHQDYSSPETYATSIEPNRLRFRQIIGADHTLDPAPRFEIDRPSKKNHPTNFSIYADSRTEEGFTAYSVRWPVLDGVTGEGILLVPPGVVRACVVAIPDADDPPSERAVEEYQGKGLQPFARRLAENGCMVLIPTLIDRRDEFSGNPALNRFTNQPHREFIYRMSYELGSHVIGYEVLKVMAAIDAMHADFPREKIGLAGYGEGGLIAFYTAAIDTRVRATAVSGYFQKREELWKEPIYRNVWGLLEQFGDAEIAGLIAPQTLFIEASHPPEIQGPPPRVEKRSGAAPGSISQISRGSIESEFERSKAPFERLRKERNLHLLWNEDLPFGTKDTNSAGEAVDLLDSFLFALDVPKPRVGPESSKNHSEVPEEIPGARQKRQKQQLDELTAYTQRTMRMCQYDRRELWKDVRPKAKGSSPEKWEEMVEPLRQKFMNEVIGAFPKPTIDPNPRMRVAYDTPKFVGYETVLDVWPGVIAYGVLLVPKDLKPGEQRPVVVCQHGLEGRPRLVIEPDPTYQQFAAKLADLGYIVYAPQNPYIFEDKFRSLQRKANPLGKSLFSIILGQHQQTLNWLEKLPLVDPKRIAFYGLSYGGKTAMRIPAMEKRYCLSICSGDFNEWIEKNATYESNYSYLFTGEYEMFEFNLGRTFNYAEQAWLIAPRPFMVERGHYDGVAPDEWVAQEYARVKFLYDELGLGADTEMEVFNGPHRINGQGTFAFLQKHLGWPAKN